MMMARKRHIYSPGSVSFWPTVEDNSIARVEEVFFHLMEFNATVDLTQSPERYDILTLSGASGCLPQNRPLVGMPYVFES